MCIRDRHITGTTEVAVWPNTHNGKRNKRMLRERIDANEIYNVLDGKNRAILFFRQIILNGNMDEADKTDNHGFFSNQYLARLKFRNRDFRREGHFLFEIREAHLKRFYRIFRLKILLKTLIHKVFL